MRHSRKKATRRATPLAERFVTKVDKSLTTKCWPWTAAKDRYGYGEIWDNDQQTMLRAHRFAYEQQYGSIPKGLQIDHLCRNRACVNPLHLEAVSMLVNVRRGLAGANNRAKTNCPKGHPYSPENTYYYRSGSHGGRQRACKTCAVARSVARWARKQEERYANA